MNLDGGRGPRGRGRGRRGGQGGACRRRISRFLEPCLLTLLSGDAAHGYSLVEGLAEFGFAPGTVDASVVYRLLREMEDSGWVCSDWDTAGSGPPRRVYHVTTAGDAYLATWIDDLRRTRDEIDGFVANYERHRAPGARKAGSTDGGEREGRSGPD